MRFDWISRLSSCDLARRWAIDPALARRLHALDAWAAAEVDKADPSGRLRWPGLTIISGARARPVLPALNPDAPAAVASRHLFCPALAADLRVGVTPASVTPPTIWRWLGTRWEISGGRWGGSFKTPDLNHFDIDPLLADSRPLRPLTFFQEDFLPRSEVLT